ncbi:hypothetical protein PABG_12313 [Paracoccidioides brasiliensis Pb03]|nr:hypothetical protein PABG_12313 [Paracoccidioides brasiliensis Pb03]
MEDWDGRLRWKTRDGRLRWKTRDGRLGDWETGRLGDWAGWAAGEREQVESEGREPEEHWVIGPVTLPLASKTSPLQPQQQQQQQLMERDVRLRGPRDTKTLPGL